MLYHEYNLLELLFSNHIETTLCPREILKIYKNPFILQENGGLRVLTRTCNQIGSPDVMN